MVKQELSKWRFQMDGDAAIACTVPCSMYSILLENNKIDDPFFRSNEKQLTALSERDCSFETSFAVDASILANEHVLLRFDGIDTIAEIILNGRRLGYTENMHRGYEFDVRERLLVGENTLTVRISSPLRYMREWQKKHYLAGNGQSIDGVAQIRKASYMMGWDWGPELPDMGIWKPVSLIAYNQGRLGTPAFRQFHRDGRVDLLCKTDFEGNSDALKTRFTLTSPNGDMTWTCEADIDGEAWIRVEEPQLWWPRGYGEQPLYTMTATLLSDSGEVLDEKSYRLGLRTVTVSTAKDRWGNEFCFVVNGEKIFSMGANYVPEDNLLSRMSYERSEKLIRQCVDANFNMIRVWGGGFYPHDYFYDLCDRYGLLIWQDCMIACNCIWLTPSREENMMAEFRENILRLRHHASLALINGNNEVEEAMASGKPPRNTPVLLADYVRLYHNLLPELCEELTPDTFYWPSSPASTQYFDGKPGDENYGDAHCWTVWHGRKPYEYYRERYFRFCSEFGFEALPEPKTVDSFTEARDRNLFSPVLLTHQKCSGGNGKLMSYLSDYYLYPQSFMGVIYGSQLLQADAIRTAVEHFRRHRGRCMGSLYWQLNDCWPTVSWASLDGAGRLKALHYAARKFYAPVLLSAHENGTHVVFNLSNEQRSIFKGSVVLTVRTPDFKTVWSETVAVEQGALSSCDIRSMDFAEIVAGREDECYLTFALLDANGKQLSESVLLFVRPKFFAYRKPKLTATVTGTAPNLTLHLDSNTFAHKVRLDFGDLEPEMGDQYVSVTSERGVDIALTVAEGVTAAEIEEKVSFFTVYDIDPTCYGE